MAKPTPMLPDCEPSELVPPALAMATFTPISSPLLLSSAPPELPGLIDASVWMTGSEIVPDALLLLLLRAGTALVGEVEVERVLASAAAVSESPFGAADDAMLMLRFSALTMPSVTVPERPSGAPMATVVSRRSACWSRPS